MFDQHFNVSQGNNRIASYYAFEITMASVGYKCNYYL